MIRRATVDDLPRMEDADRAFYASSKFLRNFKMDRFVVAWTKMFTDNVGVIFMIEHEGSIVGAIGGVCYPDIYSGELLAVEFFWFIEEQYRGGGIRLYREFESWARGKNCAEIRMVHLLDSMPEKLERVYRHLGFVPAETHYVKVI